MGCEIKNGNRPVCSCGELMKLIYYQGYYDDFKYWECDNKDCELNIDDLDADERMSGSYA